MKRIAIISAIVMSGLLYNTANAQVRIRVGFNLSPRPVYVQPAAPVEYVEPANYDGDEDYYYLPEVDAYYSVTEQCYYYNDGGNWITAAFLPGAYHDFNWHTARRYEVRAPRPYMHNDYYRTRYNGAAFHGSWNRPNLNRGGYANNNRFNGDNNRRDDHHFDNRNNGYNRQNDQNRGGNGHQFNQNRDNNRGSAQQHFAQNMPQRNARGNRGDHRSARF
ncbi:MAG TPA: hypothetical protein VK668_02325 [Mucilaginibacter sp.]|nr:hypothetical protein [Mucilaginibacter sp.]